MSFELAASSVVIVAQQFNPSVMGQLWLVRHEILGEDDLRPGSVFTDVMVQVNAREFSLMVVPHQCQFSPQVNRESEQELVIEKVGAIVRTLPHTPFRAVGLNFTWHLMPEASDVPAISRSLFFVEGGPLHQEFADEDARFGAYLSKNALGARLKLDVKPITTSVEDEEVERIQFVFNFHKDVADEEDPVDCIEHLLRQWDNAREESSRIALSTMKGEPA